MDFSILEGLNVVSVVVRMVLAALFGGVIGFERGRHGRSAGLRTHILVCIGASMASLTGIFMCSAVGDPSRIASGVVSGIGFLGAGMIIVKNSAKVTGLTTAAGMWATACVGLAIGAGFYVCAIAGTVIIFMTTALLTIFEVKQKRDTGVYIEIKSAEKCNEVLDEMKKICPLMHGTDIIAPKSGIEGHVGIVTNIPTQTKYGSEEIIADLRQIDSIIMAICE